LAAAGIVLAAWAAMAGADWPDTPVERLVSGSADSSSSASVGMDNQGRFIAAYQKFTVIPLWDREDVLARRFAADGSPIGVAAYLSDISGELNYDFNFTPSLAMSGDSLVYCAWLGYQHREGMTPNSLVTSSFDFDTFAPTPVRPPPPTAATFDYEPSAGRASASAQIEAVTWPRGEPEQTHGLLYEVTGAGPTIIRGCDWPNTLCRGSAWQPALCQRSDGRAAVVFADAEVPDALYTPYNITLVLFKSDGTLIGDQGFTQVNIPADEQLYTSQVSPALAFNDNGDIVIVWSGPRLYTCAPTNDHIFACRFHWYGDDEEDPVVVGEPVQIDNDSDFFPTAGSGARPAVALTQDPNRAGAFVVAWNAVPVARTYAYEVHGQYVGPSGMPVGGEFRINQDTSDTGEDFCMRLLANSAQHTLQYGPDNQVVAVWTAYSANDTPADVHYTLLPPDYAESLVDVCCKGDIDGNELRNGLDIQPFVDILLQPEETRCWSIVDLCPADMDSDGDVDLDDLPVFVSALLEGLSCSGGGGDGGGGSQDCNENGHLDAWDIATGGSEDCNGNFIPDECDIASETSEDVDSDGIPDECEPDCNSNGVPDDKDIADETSNDVNGNDIPDECEPDCNSNGVPDAWDISQSTSADCNTNGLPDECELDCNDNGVPDDCDIDPNDPDGNEEVLPDCNGNQRPDECDIALGPPWGSLDCNDNDTPDECDLADCSPEDPSCQDCNENGFLDGCDIAAEISLDENENGIPDECEGENLMGGGGGMMQQGMFGNDDLFFGDPEAYWAAWGEYFDWAMQQGWGPNSTVSGAEQFRAMADKLRDLGLPVQDPWMPR
jgi:hypothetical protein